MSINIGNYTFEGPFKNIRSEDMNKSGVYVILGKQGPNNYKVVDVGESQDVGNRIGNHDRKSCWSRQSQDIYYACHAVYEGSRESIEQEIRDAYNPPCGDR